MTEFGLKSSIFFHPTAVCRNPLLINDLRRAAGALALTR